LQGEEQRLLADRIKAQQTVEQSVRTIQVLGTLMALVLMLQSFLLTRRATLARVQAEAALREANQQLEQRVVERTRSLRFLADAMPQLVWTLLPDGTSETYNQGWRDYTGLTDEQSRHDGWKQALHPDDQAASRDGGPVAFARGVECSGEYRLRRARDGAWRWHLWRMRPECDASGRIIRWVGT
jgi:PAS domain-containing protein